MRMFTIPNQSSVPMAWKSFTTASDVGSDNPILINRMKPSSNRDRVVDVCEELVKVTCLMRGKDKLFSDRYSERKERLENGKLLTQAEKDKMQSEDAAKKVSGQILYMLEIIITDDWLVTHSSIQQKDILESLGIGQPGAHSL